MDLATKPSIEQIIDQIRLTGIELQMLLENLTTPQQTKPKNYGQNSNQNNQTSKTISENTTTKDGQQNQSNRKRH